MHARSQVLGVGGFNSWRYKQPSMYFFDVGSNPSKPCYIKSISPKLGAITDDFFRLPNGGFLVSLMGSTEGEGQLQLLSCHQPLQQRNSSYSSCSCGS
jgi:hypothetical protein